MDLNRISKDQVCEDFHHAEEARRERTASFSSTRRGLLATASLGLVSWIANKSALAQVKISEDKQKGEKNDHTLVVVFLRGGADGLNMVVPYEDDHYHRARPNLRMFGPKDKGAATARKVLKIDDRFGFHPSLADFHKLYEDGRLGLLHACGSGDGSRSHFEAMATMERGQWNPAEPVASGWLGRWLTEDRALQQPNPLQAVAWGDTLPDMLRGAPQAISIASMAEFKLDLPDDLQQELRKMYGKGADEMSLAGNTTFELLDRLESIDFKKAQPENGAKYPDTGLGKGLQEVATLIRAGLGLEVACLDHGVWDTHVAQGADIGWQPLLMSELSQAIGAFTKDLGKELDNVTVVVMTEFGRRLGENNGLGTDHGRASVFCAIGGKVKGGKVYGTWPGLAPANLDSVGDMKVANDYRVALAEILEHEMGANKLPFNNPQGKFGLYG